MYIVVLFPDTVVPRPYAPLCACSLQSSIHAEGFRSLAEGEAVEFSVETGEDGRTKAVEVTGPDGSHVQVRRPPLMALGDPAWFLDKGLGEGGRGRRLVA